MAHKSNRAQRWAAQRADRSRRTAARATATGLILAAGVGAVSTTPAHAAAIIVTNVNDSGPGSLRDAIAIANSDVAADIITFQTGGQSNLASTLSITQDLQIIGGGVTINGNGTFHNVEVLGVFSGRTIDVTLSGLRIVGGGVNIGAGVFARGANLTIAESRITGNTTDGSGGAVAFPGYTPLAGSLTIVDSIIDNNDAPAQGGGGIFIAGLPASESVTITNTEFLDNSASDTGGAILAQATDASITITESEFVRNSTTLDGGALSL